MKYSIIDLMLGFIVTGLIFAGVIIGFAHLIDSQYKITAKDPYEMRIDNLNNYLYDVCVDHSCYSKVEKYEADPYCVKIWRDNQVDYDCGDINIELRHKDSLDTGCRCEF